MHTIDSTRPIANPVAVLRRGLGDRAVLFNPDTGDAVAINRVGLAVWRLLDGRHTTDQIVAHVARRFARVPDGAGEEVRGFIGELAEKGLVGYSVKREE
jgi:SynChlorMet cassette protein ScmD